MPFRLQSGSAKKGGRFAKVKRTPQSDRSADPTAQTVFVVLVKPDTISATSIPGIVITPNGFHMDRFMSNVMFRKVPEPVTNSFLLETGCVHRAFDVLDSEGNVLKKENQGKFWPIKSCFIPVEDPDDLDDEDRVIATVTNFANNLWATIDKKKFAWAKETELPKIVDYERDVTTVTNYSDVMAEPEDILMCMSLSCKHVGIGFKDWLNQEGDDNLYTMFKRGEIQPELAALWELPFSKMSQQDKNAYQQYKERTEQEVKKLARKMEGELEKEGDGKSD